MATYLIGDIQGCYGPLKRLLKKIEFDPGTDRLWSCGDLVNRGGKSLKVLRLLQDMQGAVSVTLGNHDLHLLAMHRRYPGGDSPNREFNKVLRAPDCERLIGWLNRQPLAAWSEKYRLLRVHAGVIPQWSWQDAIRVSEEVSNVLQSDRRDHFLENLYGNRPRRWREERTGVKRLRLITNILTRLRFCDAKGRGAYKVSGPPGSQSRRYLPWFMHEHRRTADVTVAFGHWAALGLRIRQQYIAMDSGCVWGGQLSALRLEDGELFQTDYR